MKCHFVFIKSNQNFDKMEHHAQSADDALIGGLSYKLKAGASYITNRGGVSYFASGGNPYSPNGVRVTKFNLTGDQLLDPSTSRVRFQLNNLEWSADGTKYIKPLSWNPAVFFRRARIIAGGQVIEDIDDFNRLSLMITALKSDEEQLMIASEGFGSFDDRYGVVADDNRKEYRSDDFGKSGSVFQSRRVVFTPMFGLLHQEKLLPVRYCPLQIELELVNNGADAVHVGSYNGETHTANWDMTDVQVKCDLLTLDNSLENEYASHLLSGKTLPINFSTWNHTNQYTRNDNNFSAHINRALARLKSVFIILHSADGAWYRQANHFYHPIENSARQANHFYHPVENSASDQYGIADEHQFQAQIGSQLYPEYPVNSLSESLSQLRKTVGHPFQMFGRWYRATKYIIGIDLERVSGAGFTGISTKSCDLMTLNFRYCDLDGTPNSTPQRISCALNYVAILNIKDSGVELLDELITITR